MTHLTNRLTPNFQAGQWLEAFLLAAITSLLLTRFYLYVAGYPQIGGGGLHIAHMLWGGLLMLVSIVMNLAYLGQQVRLLAAVIGGAGFGLFIDELGKFITQDNNYFFQPTIALVYIIFIALFFSFRFIEQQRQHSSQEYLINALHLLEESALQHMDEQEQKKIVEYLSKADQNNPLTQQLLAITKTTSLIPAAPDWYSRLKLWLADRGQGVLQWRWFEPAISAFFIIQALTIMVIVGTSLWAGIDSDQVFMEWWLSMDSPIDWGYLLSSIVASTLLILGAMRLRWSRIQALELFRRSLLISIFLTQFFAFYEEQLSAIFGLFVNIIALLAINYLIGQQRLLKTRPNRVFNK